MDKKYVAAILAGIAIVGNAYANHEDDGSWYWVGAPPNDTYGQEENNHISTTTPRDYDYWGSQYGAGTIDVPSADWEYIDHMTDVNQGTGWQTA